MSERRDPVPFPEEEADALLLTDEEGSEVPFRLLGTLELRGKRYAVLEDTGDEDSVMIFSVVPDGEGERFDPVTDEDECDDAFYYFQTMQADYEVGPAE